MDTNEISSLAHTLMNTHGLGHVPFEFNRTKRAIGQTLFNTSTGEVLSIRFSSHYINISEADIRDTILHEIAHAIAGLDAGHGPRWKAAARRVGANPRPSKHIQDAPEVPWVPKCPTCGKSFNGLHRAPGVVRSCPKCHPQGFSKNHLLVWFKNGRQVCVSEMGAKYQASYRRVTNPRFPLRFTADA